MTIDRVTLQLLSMREAARDASGYLSNMNKTAFLANNMVQRAAGMCFILIGEAAAVLMRAQPAFVAATPQID